MRKIILTVPNDFDLNTIEKLLGVTEFKVITSDQLQQQQPPKITAPATIKRRPRTIQPLVDGISTRGQIIMRHYTAHASFSRATASRWLSAEGYNPTSASSTCSALKAKGYITAQERGIYRFEKELKVEAAAAEPA